MTHLYDWLPMPHRVAVKCPRCPKEATFEFARVVRIDRKEDIEYFKISKAFEYRVFENAEGQRWHGAIFYHGLYGQTPNAVKHLPEGYSVEQWEHSESWFRYPALDIGTKYCLSCGLRQKSTLKWPEEAYFKVEIKGETLWAFNRESLVELRDFIASTTRKFQNYQYGSLLRHVPKLFLDHKNRETLVSRIDKLLCKG